MCDFFTFNSIIPYKFRYALVFFISIYTCQVSADDLATIYDLALSNDPQYQAAVAEFNAEQESKVQSRSVLLPQLNISGYVSNIEQDITGGIFPGDKKYDSTGYSVTLTQSIYQRENFVGLDQANARVNEAKALLDDVKHALLLRVATQYFAVLAAKDNLIFSQAENKAISEQLIQSEQRFNVGLSKITDVHEARARYDQTVASEIEAKNILAISREAVHEITGKEHTDFSRLIKDHPLVEPEPSDIEQWIKRALIENAILRKAKKTVDIARHEISKNSAGHYPSLDLVAKYSNDEVGEGSINPNKSEETSVTLQLNIPLYQGGVVSSRTRAASYRLQRAKELLEKQRRATIRQTRTAYLSVVANISQVKALKQALASTQIALEATQAGFEVGVRTGVDVLNSQRELYRASRDYSRSRYDYILQTLQLKYASGTLSKNDILNINRWLK